MNRFFQITLIVSALGFSWLGMMAVHECGHVLAAWTSGGVVAHVDLHPLGFSRTQLTTNPCPLWVTWGGPLLGCLVPLAILVLVRITARDYTYLATFFAGFCLIANGAYLAGGAIYGGNTLDDGAVILNNGGAIWQLLLFAAITVSAGLWMLNGLGKHFGLGNDRSPDGVDHKAAIGTAVAFVVVVVIELLAASQ